ncbi:MAG: pitrilysin family protein [Acidobacteriota bacterium]|nr:pitrilysin family protein [Acidobacteriota bacterium]
MKKLLSVVLLLLLGASVGAGQEIDIPYEKFVLDNGLTLIVHEDRKTPIVAVNLWYHVGSKNEKPGKTGFAHLFEHLMFNGSENFDGDYFIALERAGATGLNGTTSQDRTNYFQNVPTSALDVALWMESDRMGHFKGAITQERLDEQRGVVQNEKRQGDNRPYAVAFDLITQNTYPKGHPYSWRVIGSLDDLDAASLEDAKEWFATYYGAANAVVVVAGDIDGARALERVEHFFGDIPPGPPVAHHESWVAKRSGTHRQRVEDRVPQSRIYKVWNVPEAGSLEMDRLDLVSDVLGYDKNSRLFKRLVYDDQLATSAQAYISPSEIAGQFMITASAQPGGDLAAVEAAIDEELERFLRQGPTAEELSRVKTQYRARFIRGIERIGGFGGKSDILARGEVYQGNPGAYKATLARVEAMTAEDLRQTAVDWLSDGVYILEVAPFPSYTVAETGADRSAVPEVEAPPPLEWPELQRTELSNGLKIILAERHDTPIVQIELIVDAGTASDQFASPGVASLAGSMLDEGTTSRSALEISDILARLGSTLSSGSQLDTNYVEMSTLRENLDSSVELFGDVVLNPAFPESELERLRKSVLASIARQKSSPTMIGYRILPKLLYGTDHAYANLLAGSGSEESVQAITQADLKRFHQTWFQPATSTLVVVGATTMDEIRPKVEAHLGSWKNGAKAPTKNLAAVTNPPKRAIYLIDKPDAEQSVILGGLVMPPSSDPGRVTLESLNSIVGGTFTSRLNMNLREDKHWSYGTRSTVFDARGQRPWIVSAPVQTDKTKESLAELDRELRELVSDRPPTPEELEKAKVRATLTLAGQYETKSALRNAIREIVTYGLPEDFYLNYAERVAKVELGDLEAEARKSIPYDRIAWVIVGDREKVQGPLEDLDLAEILVLDVDGKPVS